MQSDELAIKILGFSVGLGIGLWVLSELSPVFGGSIKSVLLILFGIQ